MNKFPIPIAEGENIKDKIEELKHTVKFQSKKASCLGTSIGNVETGEDSLRHNLTMAINFLVSLTKKGWQNIGTLYIKTSMGKSTRIFG
jgi:large subunit ribosomal protein L10Ae